MLDCYQKLITVFYVDLCAVLDHANKKKECHTDSIIESIHYERDKNAAHKDFGYNPSKNDKNLMTYKKQIRPVRQICSDILPDSFELTFVSYDRLLFRTLNKITHNKEICLENERNISGASSAILFNHMIGTNNRSWDLISADVRKIREMEDKQYAI